VKHAVNAEDLASMEREADITARAAHWAHLVYREVRDGYLVSKYLTYSDASMGGLVYLPLDRNPKGKRVVMIGYPPKYQPSRTVAI
jgi:hypothetical protein